MPAFFLLSLGGFLVLASVGAIMRLMSESLSMVVFEFNLLTFSGVTVSVPLVIDYVSISFGATVLLISGSVLFFSNFYMKKEKYFLRFHLLVGVFVFSMLLLIFSPNLVSLILGWDGLGVTSFLLVVYFNSHKSFNAGMITALTNRVGDCLLLLAMAFMMAVFPFSFFLSAQFPHSPGLTGMALLVGLAACTKSAQIPFSSWLPAAMAAPTPVSSLVHSSTLVTAGVYLLLRFSQFLHYPLNKLLFVVGMMTMIMASLSAIFETDMKKIIALSTLSQLGLMMTGVGANMLDLALFHLLTHAFFKAMMFMAVGSMIHLNGGIQDLRISSVKGEVIGPSLGFLMVSNFSLMGAPYMSGFYSKDLIIEASMSVPMSSAEELLFFLSVALSVAYSLRFMLLLIWGSLGFTAISWIEDSDSTFFWSMVALWGLAISGGSCLSWAWVSPHSYVVHDSFKLTIFAMMILGGLLAPHLITPKSTPSRVASWGAGNLWAMPFISPMPALVGQASGKTAYSLLDISFIPFSLTAFFSATEAFSLVNLKLIRSPELAFSTLLFSLLWLIY